MKVVIFIVIMSTAFAQKKNQEIVYKYKEFQEFDLETIGVEGEVGAPDDLSLNSRFQRKFRNRLPIRKNFNPEIRRAIEVIR